MIVHPFHDYCMCISSFRKLETSSKSSASLADPPRSALPNLTQVGLIEDGYMYVFFLHISSLPKSAPLVFTHGRPHLSQVGLIGRCEDILALHTKPAPFVLTRAKCTPLVTPRVRTTEIRVASWAAERAGRGACREEEVFGRPRTAEVTPPFEPAVSPSFAGTVAVLNYLDLIPNS
jgi:hypothetical protein